ncbi:hypothetical protein GLOIN_2v1785010 [Rhizophagus clarus]|uniref:Uncharacterized protein n=1 Tax=Rhizophagus clarus TaxID=94130 RepID=A0A8H3L3Z2_9GLOM|nr:hypothetical protein GLOIN_2v1785010 [Rhizophagus clarus]
MNLPESMMVAMLVHKDNEVYLISHNINMFKEIKLPDGKRKIIGYLSNWDDLHRLINSPSVWNGETVDWTRHTSSSHNPRKAIKSDRNKSNGKTQSTNISPLNNSTGSTNTRQDSTNPDYDGKKSKSKSKRSSTSKKAILAEIAQMNEVLETLLKRTTI